MSASDLESVSFKVFLSSDWWRLPPHVKIYLNDELITDTEVTEKSSANDQKIIEFKKELAESEHELVIELLDKEIIDTQIDENHNIIKDKLLNIDEIEIDDIPLGFLLYTHSNFYPDSTKNPPNLPAEIPHLRNIGYNGKYKIKFTVPTYTWFLETL